MTEWTKTVANAKFDTTQSRIETWENIQRTFPDNFSTEEVHQCMAILDPLLKFSWMTSVVKMGDSLTNLVRRLMRNAVCGDLKVQYPNVFKKMKEACLDIDKPVLNEKTFDDIQATLTAGAAVKAKSYTEHVGLLLDEVTALREKLTAVQADPELLSKLKVAAKIDPDHLRRLLALEKAVCGAGYCGMPTAG